MELGERTGPTPGSEFGFGERFYTGSAGSEFGERTRSNPGSSGLEKGTGRTLVRQVRSSEKGRAEPWFGSFGEKVGPNPGLAGSEFGEWDGPNPGSAGSEK